MKFWVFVIWCFDFVFCLFRPKFGDFVVFGLWFGGCTNLELWCLGGVFALVGTEFWWDLVFSGILRDLGGLSALGGLMFVSGCWFVEFANFAFWV